MQPAKAGKIGVSSRRRLPLHWLGVLPFFVFVMLFLILPTMRIVIGAFRLPMAASRSTILRGLNTEIIRTAYWTSIKISVISALLGCAIGSPWLLPWFSAACRNGFADPLLTFSGVASNFAGVPLAFAFLATLGPLGMVTVFLQDAAWPRFARDGLQPAELLRAW